MATVTKRRQRGKERLTENALTAEMKHGKAIHDGGGLYLRPMGSGRWYWYLQAASPLTGKTAWFALLKNAPYEPKATRLVEARFKAAEFRTEIAAGRDPTEIKRQVIEAQRQTIEARADEVRKAVSFRDVFSRWRATDLQPAVGTDGTRTGRKDGGKFIADAFEKHIFPTVGALPFAKVGKAEVTDLLDTVKGAGHMRRANQLLGFLKQLYRFAEDRAVIEATPIQNLTKKKVGGKDTGRKRFLTCDEIQSLPAKLAAAKLDPRTELAVWVLLATSVRAGELVGAAWSDHATPVDALRKRAASVGDHGAQFGVIDLEVRQWRIFDTKNQRDHTIHLSRFAVEKLTGFKSITKQIGDRQRDGKTPLKNRSKQSDALCLPGGRWTSHDLRRTAATLMAGLGVNGDVINECQNHIQKDAMSRVYIHDRRLSEQAIAFDKLGEELQRLTGGTVSNVISFPRKTAA
jgi:integrase